MLLVDNSVLVKIQAIRLLSELNLFLWLINFRILKLLSSRFNLSLLLMLWLKVKQLNILLLLLLYLVIWFGCFITCSFILGRFRLRFIFIKLIYVHLVEKFLQRLVESLLGWLLVCNQGLVIHMIWRHLPRNQGGECLKLFGYSEVDRRVHVFEEPIGDGLDPSVIASSHVAFGIINISFGLR